MRTTAEAIVTHGDEDSLVAVDYQADAGRVTIERIERDRAPFELSPEDEAALTAWLEEHHHDAEDQDEEPEDDFNGEY